MSVFSTKYECMSHVLILQTVIGAWWEPYCPARLRWHHWNCIVCNCIEWNKWWWIYRRMLSVT